MGQRRGGLQCHCKTLQSERYGRSSWALAEGGQNLTYVLRGSMGLHVESGLWGPGQKRGAQGGGWLISGGAGRGGESAQILHLL